jgi:hypothetical protein
MKLNNIVLTQRQRIEELFTLANQLFSVAKTVSEYHTAEIKRNMVDAISYAKTVAHEDMAQLKSLQTVLSAEATKRMRGYQVRIKNILDEMDSKSADKHLKQARDALADWHRDTRNKLPRAAVELGQLTKDLAEVGARAFKKGHKLVHATAGKAEKNLKQTYKKKGKKVKKVAVKKIAQKKAAVNKTAVKKSTLKKTPLKKVAVKRTAVRKSPVNLMSSS